MNEQYEETCKDKFREIENDFYKTIVDLKNDLIIPMREDVSNTKTKVFNGLNGLPGEVKWLKRILVSILISIVLGGGSGLVYWAQRMTQLESLIKYHMEADYGKISEQAR